MSSSKNIFINKEKFRHERIKIHYRKTMKRSTRNVAFVKAGDRTSSFAIMSFIFVRASEDVLRREAIHEDEIVEESVSGGGKEGGIRTN